MEHPTHRDIARLALEATITADALPGSFAWAITWDDGRPHTAFARTTPRLHPMPDDAWKAQANGLLARLLLACGVPTQDDGRTKAHTSLEWDGAWTAHRSMAAKADAERILARWQMPDTQHASSPATP